MQTNHYCNNNPLCKTRKEDPNEKKYQSFQFWEKS